MTIEKSTTDNRDYQIQLLGEINKKISNQRNEAHNRIAQLELVIESNQREIQSLKSNIEGNKLFKENKKDYYRRRCSSRRG